jgi:hypothetical protein
VEILRGTGIGGGDEEGEDLESVGEDVEEVEDGEDGGCQNQWEKMEGEWHELVRMEMEKEGLKR